MKTKVDVTYTGDYSALDVTEIGRRVVRGEPFKADRDWAARMIGTDPRQWRCEDADVQEAAKKYEAEEAEKQAAFDASTKPAVIEEVAEVPAPVVSIEDEPPPVPDGE